MDAVNLDCMHIDDLRIEAAGLPDWRQRRYAEVKIMAMQARLNGGMEGALYWEGVCEEVYQTLPADLRWLRW